MNVTASVLSLALLAAPALAAPSVPQPTPVVGQAPGGFTQEDFARIVPEVRKRLAGLTDYAVFDWLTFGIQGRTLILQGYASRPILKSEAGNSVKGIEGIERVQNDIKVLPLSPNDDRIRIEVFRRIYTFPSLRRYTGSPVGFGGDFNPIARAAGGITQDPPLGYHAIHIIVENGHVTLYGVVDSKQDAETATIQANTAPGAFSVVDDIDYPGKQGNTQK